MEQLTYTLNHKALPLKKPKEIQKEKELLVDKYLGGSLNRFLRKHYKQTSYQLVFSVLFRKWKKDKRVKVVKLLKKRYKYPQEIVDIVNIMRTLYLYYEKDININTLKAAIIINDMFETELEEHRKKRNIEEYNKGRIAKTLMITKEEAFKEQKARGFIHVNEFEDYNMKYAHIYSNVDRDYIYPLNLPFDHLQLSKNPDIVPSYTGLSLIGVQGFTRIVIPKLENKLVRKKRTI